MASDVAARARTVIEAIGLSQPEAAERLGVPYSTLRAHIARVNPRPLSEQVIAAFARELNVNLRWLLLGHGGMFEGDRKPEVGAPRLCAGRFAVVRQRADGDLAVVQGQSSFAGSKLALVSTADRSASSNLLGPLAPGAAVVVDQEDRALRGRPGKHFIVAAAVDGSLQVLGRVLGVVREMDFAVVDGEVAPERALHETAPGGKVQPGHSTQGDQA